MRRINVLLCFLLILLMVSFAAARAGAMNCDGGIITTGDRSSDVLVKCGTPDFKDSHQEEVVRRDGNIRQKIFITVEEWTYDLGSNQLVRIVTIKNGTVTDIQERRRP